MKPKTQENKQNIKERPPVITIMGHIDHGKSTLLDYIRKTNTTKDEAGGITQHVAAYEVIHTTKEGLEKRITFLDTPGHEAFAKIRERGARVADIVVLVVSAEEGVKPQTLEALKCIKESETPYVVAINKIDSPKADIGRTKQNLAEHEIYIEGYGGDTPWVALSGKTGEGVGDLLDLLTLVAEMEELKGDANDAAEGVVIEANLDSKKGTSATLVIKNGTLRTGQFVTAGDALAPVRSLENDHGKRITEATFSSPVTLTGFSKLPAVGSIFKAFDSKKDAEKALQAFKATEKKPSAKSEIVDETIVYVPVVIKADVAGTLEAILHEIKKIETEKVKVKLLQSGIGNITETDVKTASAEGRTVIIGFGSKVDAQATSAAERIGIVIETFDIIYKMIEWLQAKILESTPKITVEETTGRAKILKIFSRNRDKQVVGGRVEIGTIRGGKEIKILRRDVEIAKGRIRELQQQKQKTSEVAKDTEFGALIEAKIEIAEGDRIECFDSIVK